jgi:hypothetical protein
MGWFRWFRSYPDRIGTVNSYQGHLNRQVGILTPTTRQADGAQREVNAVVAEKNRYNQLSTDYEREYGISTPGKETGKQAILKEKTAERIGIETQITDWNNRIYNTYSSSDGTRSMAETSSIAENSIEKRIVSIYNDTEDRNKDIYYGMNRTNTSLLKTIKATRNNHTADISKVTYQTDQTSYFSWLNNLLLSLYLL